MGKKPKSGQRGGATVEGRWSWERDPSKFAGLRVAVVGLGRSNLALAKFLVRHGAVISGRDQKDERELGDQTVSFMRGLGCDLVLGEGYLEGLEEFDAIFLTPGMRKDFPQIQRARERGVPISGEVPLFLGLCRGKVVGVTGSAGKTTTTSLTGLMFQAGRPKVFVGGNIGTPLIQRVAEIDEESWVVMEISSFQLELATRSPHIGVITNFSPDHLNVHDTMENYMEAKANILRFQGPSDFAVLNRDNVAGWEFGRYVKGNLAAFSRTQPVPLGAFLGEAEAPGRRGGPGVGEPRCSKDAWVWFRGLDGKAAPVFPVSSLSIPGRHNLENALAATAAAMLGGVPAEAVRRAAEEFKGVEHRMEMVRELRGVRYWNDSIATAPERAMAALETLEGSLVLIAGGYDKGVSFDRLGQAIADKARVLILIGKTAPKIRSAVEAALASGGVHALEAIYMCRDLGEAVLKAREEARPGESVILSPACASFDMFRNFEERGRVFKELVAALD